MPFGISYMLNKNSDADKKQPPSLKEVGPCVLAAPSAWHACYAVMGAASPVAVERACAAEALPSDGSGLGSSSLVYAAAATAQCCTQCAGAVCAIAAPIGVVCLLHVWAEHVVTSSAHNRLSLHLLWIADDSVHQAAEL